MPGRAQQRGAKHDLDALRRLYLDQLEVLDVAAQQLQSAMDSAAGALDLIRAHVQDGGNISDFAGVVDPVPLRTEFGTAFGELERARHRGQQLMFRILQAEGRSTADIARAWGISRQLVSRLINEPL
jgi:hypothetical protein